MVNHYSFAESVETIKTLVEKANAQEPTDYIDIQGVTSMLMDLNRSSGYQENNLVKALVLIDGTSSMNQPIKNVMNCIDTYFNVVCEKLKENGYSTKLFKMQIAVYRNYSSGPEGILEVSQWAAPSDPSMPADRQGPVLLKNFLRTIKAKDGQGFEAMEIGLAHALKEI
jgi:hypothetical protein